MKNKVVDIKLYTPQEYQRAVHKGLAEHWEDSVHIIKAVRQCGKSIMLVNILIKCSLEHANQTSVLISPTFKQAKNLLNQINKAFKATPYCQSSNSSDLIFTFSNGSSIQFLSAEQGENIRGYTVSKYGVLCIDEAAYISDEVYYTATPFTNASHAPIIIVSTPRFKSGFFYEFFMDGMNKKGSIYSYDFADYDNPFITEEKLNLYRNKMPLNLFKADYLGQWMENNSELFGDFTKIINKNPYRGGRLIMGCDWGVGKSAKSNESDYTAVSIFNDNQEQVYIERWNDLDETETIKRIVDIAQQQKVYKIIAETNSIGNVYLGLLKKEIQRRHLAIQVKGFDTTNTSKNDIIQYFIVQVQNRTMTILDDIELKLEMSVYQLQKTPKGAITYNAENGYHDDEIIATALALEGLRHGDYNVR